MIEQAELDASRTALLVVDIQERLCAAMPPEVVEQTVRSTQVLLAAARLFQLPVVLTEQYAKGLGPTVSLLVPWLAALAPGQLHRIEKTCFSAAATPEFVALAPRIDRDTWILAGMETHVCVLQTARELRRQGAAVHAVADAMCSRTKANFRAGLEQQRAIGVVVSTMETAVFSLLRDASSPHFKELSKLIK
ncbi:MAG: isochorismatase family protein [Kofleriaceae bacterium]